MHVEIIGVIILQAWSVNITEVHGMIVIVFGQPKIVYITGDIIE